MKNSPVFTAIVTGSGRGIGAATALRFAQLGWNVVITSRTESELNDVAAEIPADRCLKLAGDLSQPQFIEELFQKTMERFGRIDCLVNNAGVARIAKFEELTLQDWDQTQNLNVRASFLCAQHAFRQMMKQPEGGSIVNVSSLAGVPGTSKFLGFAAYSASKFAVSGLTECLAEEGRPYKIRVNAIAPGAVDTVMLHQAAPGLQTSTTPADIAKTICFLGDPKQSGPLTGSVVQVHSNERSGSHSNE